MTAKSAYIHIPFCRGKCFYCSFVSYNKLELVEDYLCALEKQVDNEYKDEKFNTLYLGGGTPSILTTQYIGKILSQFKFENNAEITMEVNPNDVSFDYLKSLLDIGINRLSIGVQTFDDDILKLINRRHNSTQAIEAVENAIKCGFKNISLDFIYGLPNQSIDGFSSDLKKAIDYDIQHISLYGLKIENNCYFSLNPPDNLPDLDLQADMYLNACEIMKKNNFNRYEVSNFARSGFESKHNLNYWNAANYYGFGCAASGYVNDIRYTNIENLENYIANPLKKAAKSELSTQEKLEEAIFLGFRKTEGIEIASLNKYYGIDFDIKYAQILQKYEKYFIKTEKGYALNTEGTLISNVILSEFIDL